MPLNLHKTETFLLGFVTQVMLMSLKAGGVGLNLTAASNVFIMVICPQFSPLPSDDSRSEPVV